MIRHHDSVRGGDPNRATYADMIQIPDQPWMASALCAQTDPESFFPEKGGSVREAKRICNGDLKRGTPPCPVRAECLAYALQTRERFGIYGGLTEKERRKLFAKREAS